MTPQMKEGVATLILLVVFLIVTPAWCRFMSYGADKDFNKQGRTSDRIRD